MKPIPSYLLLLLLVACNHQPHKESPALAVFSPLQGSWAMQQDAGMITETWRAVNDSLLEGRSDFVMGDSVVPLEQIRLYKQGALFFYEVTTAGQSNQQPVAFTITSKADSGFVAENPQHDYPRRISYRFIHRDSIHAWIDDGAMQPAKRTDFHFTRKKP